MSKRDKFFQRMTPLKGRAPYGMDGGKIIKPPEPVKEDCGSVKGCGDVNCEICMPKGGRGGGGKPDTDGKRGETPLTVPRFSQQESRTRRTEDEASLVAVKTGGGKSAYASEVFKEIDRVMSLGFGLSDEKLFFRRSQEPVFFKAIITKDGLKTITKDGLTTAVQEALEPEPETPEEKLKREAATEAAAEKQRLDILRYNEMQAERDLREGISDYFLETAHELDWDDVVGNDNAKLALMEAIEYPVKHADLFKFYNKKSSKGVLLSGPPGCGKTMFAKAAASRMVALYGDNKEKAPCAMLVINGPSIQSPYVGVTEGIIRDVFEYARAFRKAFGYPLVVFIDEADAILPSRDGSGGRRALPWEESNVATFLTEMDGMEESGAFVIIATNRPHMIDEAILRDGRCDRKIQVERPTREVAEIILSNAMKNAPLSHSEMLDNVESKDELLAILRKEIARQVVETFWEDWRALLALRTDKGIDYLRLRDIVNGAMLVGLVEKAKSVAFNRDLKDGTMTGIGIKDFEDAIQIVMEDNTTMMHTTAIEEYVERTGVKALTVSPIAKPAMVNIN